MPRGVGWLWGGTEGWGSYLPSEGGRRGERRAPRPSGQSFSIMGAMRRAAVRSTEPGPPEPSVPPETGGGRGVQGVGGAVGPWFLTSITKLPCLGGGSGESGASRFHRVTCKIWCGVEM